MSKLYRKPSAESHIMAFENHPICPTQRIYPSNCTRKLKAGFWWNRENKVSIVCSLTIAKTTTLQPTIYKLTHRESLQVYTARAEDTCRPRQRTVGDDSCNERRRHTQLRLTFPSASSSSTDRRWFVNSLAPWITPLLAPWSDWRKRDALTALKVLSPEIGELYRTANTSQSRSLPNSLRTLIAFLAAFLKYLRLFPRIFSVFLTTQCASPDPFSLGAK